MATITIRQYINNLEEQKKLIADNIPLAIAAQDAHAKMVERIFDEGLDGDGFKRSYNSTDEIYISPIQSPRKLTPRGKPSDRAKKITNTNKSRLKEFGYTKSESKAILQRKTTFFESYKAFRQALGKEAAFWNLQLFGNLRTDFTNGLTRLNDNVWQAKVKRQDSLNKLENKKILNYFKLNDEERQFFKDSLLSQLLKLR